MKKHWSDNLPTNACAAAKEWARTQKSYASAWRNCERGDWLLWLAGSLSGEPGSDARKKLVLAACDCAELSAHLASDDEQTAIALCLTIARDWASGGVSDLDDVRADTYAAYAAAYAYAAYAAAYAAYAAASATRARVLAECADIVRSHYPRAPKLQTKESVK